jgi:hypothetical protein
MMNQPKQLVTRGGNVYFIEPQDKEYKSMSSEDIGDFQQIVKDIESAGTKAAKLKLLNQYASLYKLNAKQVEELAEAAGIKKINKSAIDELSGNVCQKIFEKFTKRYQYPLEFTEENWRAFKEEEFKKIVKKGTDDVTIPQELKKITDVELAFKQDEFGPIQSDANDAITSITHGSPSNTDNSVALQNNAAKQKYREGIYAVIKFIDGELKKCLKKFLKEKGETKLGAYSEFNPSDGRRQRRRSKAKRSDGKRSRKAKKSGKHSNAMLDGKSKRRYRRSKRSNAMLDGKSKRRRRSKRVHFDGTKDSALKKWLESLKRK